MRALPTAIWLAVGVFVGVPTALGRPPERVGPERFGQVARANRGSLVRIRTDKSGAIWTDGVVIGAEGEVLFPARPTPTPRMWVAVGDAAPRAADLLGFDRALGVAVARLTPGPRLTPARADDTQELWADRWLVVLTHDKTGQPTSHAGQVVGTAAPGGLITAELPGRPGSPLFGSDGALVAVAVEGGKRRVRARPLAGLMPFLRRVVLGGAGGGR
ncbi:MAG: trypsin-like peptidase domain-containing protein [Deltaproteobacteria bacterium]|nr:trypsin-like peptidase domain-containing protein [Deltaproteobacteria bacterium]